MTKIHVLLDPIRDRAYLQSLTNPTSTAPDAGLGVIDNPFFFEAGHYKNGILSSSMTTANNKRLFFCWLGSPQGTTDESPKFSLFCARVNEEVFDLEKPAPQWLDPPFLVLSYDQLSRDIINWFDNVMTANGISASNGVASVSSTQYVPGYGYILVFGNVSGTVNMTGTPEMKQVHFVYDPLDDTVLMYLSMMTPNWTPNQKTIYVYKFPVSLLEQGQSINSYASNGLTPTTSLTPPPNDRPYFLGGLIFPRNLEQLLVGATGIAADVGFQLEEYPQFSISFDYMKLGAAYGYDLKNGYLPAIFIGTIGGTLGYPSGDALFAIALADIHNNPAQPLPLYVPIFATLGYPYPALQSTSCNSLTYCIPIIGWALKLDTSSYGIYVDKFGNIIPGESFGLNGGYVIPFTTPINPSHNSSSRLKMLYLAPIGNRSQGYFGLGFAWTEKSIITPTSPLDGLSKPYIFSLKGKTFITFSGHHYDNYVNGVAAEVNNDDISPKGKTLITVPSIIVGQTSPGGSYYLVMHSTFSYINGVVAWTFGKKYARITASTNGIYYGIVSLYRAPQDYDAAAFQLFMGLTPSNYNNNIAYTIVNPGENIPGDLIILTSQEQWTNAPASVGFPISERLYVKDRILFLYDFVYSADFNMVGPFYILLEGD